MGHAATSQSRDMGHAVMGLTVGGEDAAGGAAGLEGAREGAIAQGEVAGVDLGGAEVFDAGEGGQFGGDVFGGEVELEGLSGECDAFGEGVVGELLKGWQDVAGLGVVEDDGAADGLLGEVADGGAEGRQGEVGDDSEPGKDGGDAGVEAAEAELVGEGLVLEVDGCEGERWGDGDVVLLE